MFPAQSLQSISKETIKQVNIMIRISGGGSLSLSSPGIREGLLEKLNFKLRSEGKVGISKIRGGCYGVGIKAGQCSRCQ